IPTLLPGVVQVNTDDPVSEQPYFVVGAESKLGQYLDFYTDDWDTYKYGYIKDIEQLMMKFAEVDGRTLDLNTLNADATAIADFEHAVATIVAKAMENEPTSVNDFMFTVKQAEDRWGQVISVRALLLAMAQNAPLDVRTRVVGDSYKIVELYPQMLDGFKDLLKSGNTYGVSARALYNWLYYMTILNDKDLLNSPAAIKTITLEELIERKLREAQNHTHDDYTVLERILKGTFKTRPSTFSLETSSTYVLEFLDAANDDELAQACVRDLMDQMQFASGRAYVDIRLPTDDARQKLINTTGRMLNEVLVAFQSMIDQLDWMSDASKAAAYAKIGNIYRNIAYPPFIVNDTLLEDHYRPMSWPAGSTFYDMQRALDKFVRYEQLSNLARRGTADRGNFVFSPAT
ncbi:Protein NEP-17 b, partial [Aphelenchoides avenae]